MLLVCDPAALLGFYVETLHLLGKDMNSKNLAYTFLVLATLISMLSVYRTNRVNTELLLELEKQEHVSAKDLGTLMPGFNAVTPDGDLDTVHLVGKDRFTLLQFLDIECPACMFQVRHFWPKLSTEPRLEAMDVITVAVTEPGILQSKLTEEIQIGRFVSTTDHTIRSAFGIETFPHLVLINPSGKSLYKSSDVLTDTSYDALVETLRGLQLETLEHGS